MYKWSITIPSHNTLWVHLPALPHLLIVRLTDGVGVKLWKKDRCLLFKKNNLGEKNSGENVMINTFLEVAFLQTLNCLFFIRFWSWKTYLSSLLLWGWEHQGLTTSGLSSHSASVHTAHLLGEPIMPGVRWRHWGVFTSRKPVDMGVTGSRFLNVMSGSSLRFDS